EWVTQNRLAMSKASRQCNSDQERKRRARADARSETHRPRPHTARTAARKEKSLLEKLVSIYTSQLAHVIQDFLRSGVLIWARKDAGGNASAACLSRRLRACAADGDHPHPLFSRSSSS